MSVVVVRYIKEATKHSFILAQDAGGDANTLHGAFEEYLVGGWTTEILSYYPSELSDYEDYQRLEHLEGMAHGEYQWD